MTIAQRLKAQIEADPDPLPIQAVLQARTVSAQVRRNRLRIGLPEYPTDEECVATVLARRAS